MTTAPEKIYAKRALSTENLLKKWQSRGLFIPDLVRAERYLEYISYYRLSAYAIPFYSTGSHHQFRNGVTFEDILTLYVFDRELRLLIMDAIERIEVAIRAQITNHMSTQPNATPFWYLDETYFKKEFSHKRLLADLERQLAEEQKRLQNDEQRVDKRTKITLEQKEHIKTQLRKENFLRHYLSQYESPRLPPCWMMVEMLTWGQLSHLYAGLCKKSDQKAIAKNIGIHAELLEAWLKTINTVRNCCAHHSRLWNRELGTALRLPESTSVLWLKNPVRLNTPTINYEKRIYPVLVALQSLLYKISPSSSWARRLKTLLEKYPTVNKTAMGIPENWHEDSFWNKALQTGAN